MLCDQIDMSRFLHILTLLKCPVIFLPAPINLLVRPIKYDANARQVRSDDGPRRLSTVPGAPPPSASGGGGQGSSAKRPPRNRFVWLGPTRRRVVGLGPGEATTIPLKVREKQEAAGVGVLGWKGLRLPRRSGVYWLCPVCS